jgi:hypothetical protein
MDGPTMLQRTATLELPPDQWARKQFGDVRLGHCARRTRLIKVAQALAERPGETIPELFNRKYDVDAAYNLFDRDEATPDAIQGGHRREVRAELSHPGRYLLLEDTTYASYTHRKEAIEGLGPIGPTNEGTQGFLLHSVLALRVPQHSQPDGSGHRPPVEILGLLDQQYLVRQPRPEGEPNEASQRRKSRDRESERWIHSIKRIGPAPADASVRHIRVADREADIYEYLTTSFEMGYGFLVRVAQDRVIRDPEDNERLGLLFEHVRSIDPIGGMYLDLRARPGEASRRAKLLISCGPVRIQSPARPGQAPGKGAPVDCWVVRAWEQDPPENAERLEWVILYYLPISSFEDAVGVVMDYATRYVIEEFHKGLKTGMKIERLQLETAHRLYAAIAVMSLVALRLVDLRELGRRCPDDPAPRSGLDPFELEILSIEVGRGLSTVRDVLLAIGRLGGHMNRRCDGMPGWITLWRGMKKLRLLVRGAKLASIHIQSYVPP